MGKVVTNASMSLDGYIAKDDDTIGRLFDWLQLGEVEQTSASPGITFHLTPQSAAHWAAWVESLGVVVVGRTLFDVADGWGGQHTMGVPTVVVTHEVPTAWVEDHPDASTTFVTDGVAAAIAVAQEIAGDRTVAVAAGEIAGQCLELGLLEEVAIDLVPVVMGGGRPFFGSVPVGDVALGDPTTCIVAERVTHLVLPVPAGAAGTGADS